MSDAILEAIKKMDPDNDNHWTIDGLAKLDTIKFLAGQPVTRDELDRIAPGFNRESLRAFRNGVPNVPVAESPPPPAEPEGTDTGPEIRTSEIEALAKEIAEQDEAILQLQRIQDETGAKLKIAFEKRDVLQLRHDKLLPPETQMDVIQKYLSRQVELSEQRGAAVRQVKESGIDLKVLNKLISPSPIDVSMKQRKRQTAV